MVQETTGVDEAFEGECRARGGPSTGTGRPLTFKEQLWAEEVKITKGAGKEPPREEQCGSRSECGKLPRGQGGSGPKRLCLLV